MKIWRLYSSTYAVAYLFSINTQEQQYYTQILGTFYTGSKVLPHWQPTMLCNSGNLDFSKVISSDKVYWVVNQKAKNILEPLIKQAVEFLPLYSKKEASKKISSVKQVMRKKYYGPIIDSVSEQKLYLINVLEIKSLKVINLKASSLQHKKKKNIVNSIEKLTFYKEQIKDYPIFKINNTASYFNNAIFISDKFKKLIQKNSLTGLDFINQSEEDGGNLVWSSPS